ncbi:MAG: MATE family efflux transporter [Deltaproteobacteria bacterium]|nr:MATE family efflux transporter [Deltaproteobacteria bacterium]
MLLQSLYALVDLAWVRSLGQEAVAGLSISLQAFFIILAVSQVVATTALAELSRAYGEGRVDDARGYASTFALVGAGVGVVAAIAAYVAAPGYVDAFAPSADVYDLGLGYFRVTTITFFSQVLLVVLGNSLRASGDFLTPMIFMIVSVTLNAVLDPLLIFGVGPFPELGLDGAAWATAFAQLVALGAYVLRLSRPSDRPRVLFFTRPRRPEAFFRRLVTRGLPAGVQFFLISAVLGIVLAAVKPYGAAWTATAGGGFRVLQQAFLPLVAIGSAAAALTGQNLGARAPDRVRTTIHIALLAAVAYGVLAGLFFFAAGRGASFFFAEDDAGYDLGALYFRWSAPMLVAFALTYVPTFALQAAGRAVLPLMAALVRVALLFVAIVVVIPAVDADPVWIFGATTVTAFVEAALDFALVERFLALIRREAAPLPSPQPAAADPP